MTDLLRIGTSSLLNMQQAINTVGHNITNVNTPGYSRQSVTFEARSAQSYGFGYVGSGAYISGVNRAADDFMTSQIHSFTASESRYRTLVGFTSRLDSLVADADNSLNTSLQGFFNAMQDVATNPASMPERHVLLSNATNLVSRVEALNSRFASLASEVDTQVDTLVRDINTLIGNLGAVNREIVSAVSAGKGNPPNDLLDYRDQLLTRLAEKVGISVVPQQDGSVNVFAGQGQALVVGTEVNLLATQPNAYDASRLDIVIKDSPGATPINRFLTGGALQAALEFRDGTLRQAQSQLGLIALGLTESFNALHEQGVDLDGNAGGKFFAGISLGVAASGRNKGNAMPQLTLQD
ncbi:MAG TPA: flagellar hook-associated protein FlgK, partial [Hyphomicrobiales bacterium]|nr:flagellar hook-associated protein FlgK [Hyphomicrobiales bacterium]